MLTRALGLERSKLVSLCGAGGKTSLMFALAREFTAAGERVLMTTTTKMACDEVKAWPCFAAASAEQLLERAKEVSGAAIAYSRSAADGERLVGFAPELVDELMRTEDLDRILVEADGSARRPLKAPAAHEPVIPATTQALIIVAGLNGLGLPLQAENVFRAEIWATLSGLALGASISAESLAKVVLHEEGLARGCPAGSRRILFLNRAESPRHRARAKQVAEFLAAQPECSLDRVVSGYLLPEPRLAEVTLL